MGHEYNEKEMRSLFLQNFEFEARTSKKFFKDTLHPAISQKTLLSLKIRKKDLKKYIINGLIEECYYSPTGGEMLKGYYLKDVKLSQTTKFKKLCGWLSRKICAKSK